MPDLKSATITSVFWKFFEKAGSQAASLVVQMVLARLLDPTDYGVLAIMVVFINIANVFVQNGFATSLIQATKVDDESLSSVFWLTLGIGAVLYVVIWLISPLIASFYEVDVIEAAIRVLALTILIGALSAVQTAIISRSMQFKMFFRATIVSVVLSGAIGIGIAFFGGGVWALVAQQLTFGLVNCAILTLQTRWKPSLCFNGAKARGLFSFGWKLLVSGLLETGYQSLSDLIIGRQFSTSNLGLVSQGKKIPMALGNSLDGSIQPVMLSAVSHVQSDLAYAKRLVRRGLKTSTFVIVPAMSLFGIAATPIVSLLFGDKWLPCVPFVQMYCFIYALLPIHTTNLQALNGLGRSDLFLKLELIKKAYGIFFILFGAFVLQDVYLLVASYMLSSIISTFVNAYPNKKVIGYSYWEQVKDIAPAFVLAAVSGAAAYPIIFLGLPDIVTILLQAIVMLGLYLLLAKLFKVEELSYLLDTLKQIVAKRKSGAA